MHFALWVRVLARSVGLSQMGLDMMRGGRMADLLFLNGRGGGILDCWHFANRLFVCSFRFSFSFRGEGSRHENGGKEEGTMEIRRKRRTEEGKEV